MVALVKTKDATFLNAVANDPAVRPWLGLDGASLIDLQPLLNLPGAFALQNEWGGFVFVPQEPGVFEFHTQFLPAGRGRRALAASREACRMMFEVCGACDLQTYVPHGNAAAKWLVRLVGFSETHADGDQSYWLLTREAWQARAASAVT